VSVSQPAEFALNFRIPAWAEGADISINGQRIGEPIRAGSFATVRREWKTGDRAELTLPMTGRLQPIDAQHPDTVALLRGPLVFFAITDSARSITRSQLLNPKRVAQREWQVETPNGSLRLLPFTSIEDEQYSTYLKVS